MKKLDIKKQHHAAPNTGYDFSTFWGAWMISTKLEKARPATIEKMISELSIESQCEFMDTERKRLEIELYVEDIIMDGHNAMYDNGFNFLDA